MTDIDAPHLRACLRQYQASIPGLTDLAEQLQVLVQAPAADEARLPGALVPLYDAVYPLLEKALWQTNDDEFDALLAHYQALFREQEGVFRQQARSLPNGDDRYSFVLGIPVADRPRHLEACLESIYQVLEKFGYGGQEAGVWKKITIIVAEDSRKRESIEQHGALIEAYRKKGLQIEHYHQQAQYELLQQIPDAKRGLLGNLLTRQPVEKFYLKGQAANRNLIYLKFLQMTDNRQRTLYYLVDSDQSFCVNRLTSKGDEAVYALNYFYLIDRIFRCTDTLLLTGKMVGDPPVSPAVMAAGFLEDLIAFFSRLAQTEPGQACCFHALPSSPTADAAYHDMAQLFGFRHRPATFPYRCPITEAHDHVACLQTIARNLNGFFFGEHLTRKTHFVYGEGYDHRVPARTIYPGNYVVNGEGLKYVIPFGHLRLRMSGPTAGRLIAAEIGDRFVSVNAPHLHRRTTGDKLEDDFRPGVEQGSHVHAGRIDLANEFERQFFGDLMLFTTEALVQQVDIDAPFEAHVVSSILAQKEQEMLALYRRNHDAILETNRELAALVFDSTHWWLESPALTGALRQIRSFIDNIEYNFGETSAAWQAIQSAKHRAERKGQILEALIGYRQERDAWDSLFAQAP